MYTMARTWLDLKYFPLKMGRRKTCTKWFVYRAMIRHPFDMDHRFYCARLIVCIRWCCSVYCKCNFDAVTFGDDRNSTMCQWMCNEAYKCKSKWRNRNRILYVNSSEKISFMQNFHRIFNVCKCETYKSAKCCPSFRSTSISPSSFWSSGW